MTRSARTVLRLATPLVVFGALLAALTLVNRLDAAAPVAPALAPVVGGVADRAGGDRLRELQAAIAARPREAAPYAALGETFLQRARETGDPGWYARAGRAFAAGLRRDPRDVGALLGAGTLANLRHDFRTGLRLGEAAHRAEPALTRPYVVLADAQIELGRYRAALASIQRLVDLKPGLAAYARASYFRELSGDRAGAIAAMRLAVSAGGTADSVAYVQVLLGDLELGRGRIGAARDAYRAALAAVPGHPQALAGLARVAVAGGDLRGAAARLRPAVARLPLTTNLTLLADVELAAGRRVEGAAQLAVVRAQRRLLAAAGAVPDAEAVLFEADHGEPVRAVVLGRRVWRSAPSVRSADALGWALTRAGRPREGLRWARRALRLGSLDPLFRSHAGIAARAAGASAEAARDLRIAAVGRGLLSPPAYRRVREALR
ncbi:MAG TPA: tetratricopeptide repeat protein [Conexibacter sp.]